MVEEIVYGSTGVQLKISGVTHGQKGICFHSQKTEQDPDADGPTAGNIRQGRTQLRAGLAKCPVSCGTSAFFLALQGAWESQEDKAMLGR